MVTVSVGSIGGGIITIIVIVMIVIALYKYLTDEEYRRSFSDCCKVSAPLPPQPINQNTQQMNQPQTYNQNFNHYPQTQTHQQPQGQGFVHYPQQNPPHDNIPVAEPVNMTVG